MCTVIDRAATVGGNVPVSNGEFGLSGRVSRVSLKRTVVLKHTFVQSLIPISHYILLNYYCYVSILLQL